MSIFKRYLDIYYLYLGYLYHKYNPEVLSLLSNPSAKERYKFTFNFLKETYKGMIVGFVKSKQSNSFKYSEKLYEKIWLCVGSKNNLDSIKFLNQLEDSVLMTVTGYQHPNYRTEEVKILNKQKYYWKYPFVLCYLLFVKFKRTLRIIDFFTINFAVYDVYLNVLKETRPKAIVFSNDHNPRLRSLVHAAKKMDIPTIYIQHASVSDFFPPLIFDLSLLEGNDALDKYKKNGPIKGLVELIGMPKFDSFTYQLRKNSVTKNIGVCTNFLTPVLAIYKLLDELVVNFPECQITLRPHPGYTNEIDKSKINKQILFSDGKKEGVFEFLEKQDVIVAGESGIHLDASLLKRISIYYNFGKKAAYPDYYGFVRNGLIEEAFTQKDLVSKIRNSNKDVSIHKLQYYNALIGTEKEGKSCEYAMESITKFLDRRSKI